MPPTSACSKNENRKPMHIPPTSTCSKNESRKPTHRRDQGFTTNQVACADVVQNRCLERFRSCITLPHPRVARRSQGNNGVVLYRLLQKSLRIIKSEYFSYEVFPGRPRGANSRGQLPPRCSPERPRGGKNGERMLQYGPSVALELRRSAFRLDETHIFMKNERGASAICTFAPPAPQGGCPEEHPDAPKGHPKMRFSRTRCAFYRGKTTIFLKNMEIPEK